jgi:hypothetical protein
MKIMNESDSLIPENVSGEFVILERELKNTIITSDLLNALRKTCSLQELNEILNCTLF